MVCTGNICRSPMAEGLLRNYLPPDLKSRIKVASAGTNALHGNQAQAHAVEAMAGLGIDIRNHRARQLTRDVVRKADLILVMEAAHAGMVNRLSGWGIGWGRNKARMISEFDPDTPVHDIQDPYGAPLASYQACIITLRPCIKGVILWLGGNLQ